MAEVVEFRKEEPAGLVRIERHEPILRITLNNPPANALSIAMMEALGAALDAVAGDDAIRIVVLSSTGKVFSAGHDLKEMTAHREDADGGRAFFEKTMRIAADIMLKIAALPQPVVAEIDGLATAAGCQLVASCDLAICTDTSTFCTPGTAASRSTSPSPSASTSTRKPPPSTSRPSSATVPIRASLP